MIYIANAQMSYGKETDSGLISLNLFFSGCKKSPHCPGCHNPLLWECDTNCGLSVSEWMEKIECYSALIDAVVFVGGEPLDQMIKMHELARRISTETEYKLYLYTGYETKDIPEMVKSVFDVIIAGPFVSGIPGAGLCASGNQEIIRNVKN